MENANGVYLYCLARAGLLKNLAGPSLDGQESLEILSHRGIVAVWSRVPLDEFCGGEASQRMQDLTWIASRACRHEQVVEQVMGQSPVLPARFGTIFSSRGKLEEILRLHHEIIVPFLDRVSGREEWALKGMINQSTAKEAFYRMSLGSEADRLAELTPGRRYFQEQQLRAEADRELHRWLREVCREVAQDLKGLAQEMRGRQLRTEAGAGDGQELVLNWALLVSREAVAGLKAYLHSAEARFSSRGLSLSYSGPWPPYSFTPPLALKGEA
jgi:hypothetical protein